MALDVDNTSRRIVMHHEMDSRADWARIRWTKNESTDDARALSLCVTVGEFVSSVQAGRPDRDRLLRIAGRCQAWIEQLDAEAAQ